MMLAMAALTSVKVGGRESHTERAPTSPRDNVSASKECSVGSLGPELSTVEKQRYAVSSDGKKKLKLRRGITVDSGAGNNVMPRRIVRDPRKIRPSAGSKRKMHFVAANDGKIPNEGETDFKFKTSEGNDEEMTFQIAEVNKALGAVSYLVDNGYRVIFDQDEKTGHDISMMIHKASRRISRFRREKNVWVLDAYVDADDRSKDFARRG